jgi:hypothetical protein
MTFLRGSHLNEQELALAASRDLPFLTWLRSRSHRIVCSACRQRIAEYRENQARAARAVDEFELPRAIKWDALEKEMFANIRLGLDVSEITRPTANTAAPQLTWRGAVAITAFTAVVITGWFLTGAGAQQYLRTKPAVAQVRSGSLVLRGDDSGVGVEQFGPRSGGALFLRSLGPTAQSSTIEVGLEGSLRATAIDAASGQVTVSQVAINDALTTIPAGLSYEE